MFKFSRINNDFSSYQQIITFYDTYKEAFFSTVNVELRGWFSANMCSALGAVFELITNELNDIHFDYIDPSIETILKKNNFLSYFGQKSILDMNHTTIKYLKLKISDGKYFKDYIFNELLGRQELDFIDKNVKSKIAEAIYEIFVNAQMHSETSLIFTCGQFYPSKNIIDFTITDLGIGFRNKINKRFGSNLDSIQAITWAVEDKNTIKQGTPGGIGLAFLKEFIGQNKGKMQIVSNDGFYEYDGKEHKQTFNGEFPGTVVNLQFKTDAVFFDMVNEDDFDLDDIF